MAQVAAQLANLRPPWTKHGETGSAGKPENPAPVSPRVRNHGATVVEWINRLGTKPVEDIRAVSRDTRAPVAKRQAANSLLRSLRTGFAKNGRPWAIEDTNLQLDRTLGKPKQHVEVTRVEVADPRELMVRLAEVLAESPELRAALGVSVPGVLEGEVEPTPHTPISP